MSQLPRGAPSLAAPAGRRGARRRHRDRARGRQPRPGSLQLDDTPSRHLALAPSPRSPALRPSQPEIPQGVQSAKGAPGVFYGHGHRHVDRPCSRHAVPDANVDGAPLPDEGERRLVRSAVLRTPSVARSKPRPGRRSTRRRTRYGGDRREAAAKQAADAWADATDSGKGPNELKDRKGRSESIRSPSTHQPGAPMNAPRANPEEATVRPRPQAPALPLRLRAPSSLMTRSTRSGASPEPGDESCTQRLDRRPLGPTVGRPAAYLTGHHIHRTADAPVCRRSKRSCIGNP